METKPPSPDPSVTGSPGRLLVVGCGNHFAADDGVGLEIVQRLRAGGPDGADFIELTGDLFELLDFFGKAEVILLVDAVQSGSPAGTVHLLPLPSSDVVARGLAKVSTHGWNLDGMLRLARSLGRRMPRLMLLGVELASVAPGKAPTAASNAALESVVAHFPQLKTAILDPDSHLWKAHHSYDPAILADGLGA